MSQNRSDKRNSNLKVMGYVEGASPIPSENLTAGVVTSADNAVVIEIAESNSVKYSIGASKEEAMILALKALLRQQREVVNFLCWLRLVLES